MTILKPVDQFPEWLVRKRSVVTAIVCFYFGLMGLLSLLAFPPIQYQIWHEHQAGILESLPGVGLGLIIAFASIIGAVKIWRFDRKGVLWIATVLVLAPISWIWKTPHNGDVILFLLGMVGLVISWFDLDPVGYGQ